MTVTPDEAVLLDRDGVIICNRVDYVKSWDEVEVIPGALLAIAELTQSGRPIAVVTNQSAIGRGIITRSIVDDIHSRLDELIRRAGGTVQGYFVCPHLPGDGCECRKPKPGLLLQAARHLNVDISAAVFVGDQIIDLEAAEAVGCRAILVETGMPRDAGSVRVPPHRLAPDLSAAAAMISGTLDKTAQARRLLAT